MLAALEGRVELLLVNKFGRQEMLGRGLRQEIAAALDISVRTVDTHRARLAEKLGTGSVAEQTRLLLTAAL